MFTYMMYRCSGNGGDGGSSKLNSERRIYTVFRALMNRILKTRTGAIRIY